MFIINKILVIPKIIIITKIKQYQICQFLYFFNIHHIGDAVHFNGPIEIKEGSTRLEKYANLHFCPTVNGLVIECLTELRRYSCLLPRSDMVSGLNAMLKDVLPVSLVTNLRLEGKNLATRL